MIVGDAGVITKNGWVSEDGGTKYYKDGKPYTGWHYMGATEGEKTPHWSYFGGDGKIYTGWRKKGRNDRTENRYRVPIKI